MGFPHLAPPEGNPPVHPGVALGEKRLTKGVKSLPRGYLWFLERRFRGWFFPQASISLKAASFPKTASKTVNSRPLKLQRGTTSECMYARVIEESFHDMESDLADGEELEIWRVNCQETWGSSVATTVLHCPEGVSARMFRLIGSHR